jgi:hypothetical protein
MKFYLQRTDGRYYKWSNSLGAQWVARQSNATWWSTFEAAQSMVTSASATAKVVPGDPLVALLEQQEWA